MGKAERERAKAALEHALAALGDGVGHPYWGPGIVGQRLWEVSPKGGLAFDSAAVTCIRVLGLGIFVPQVDQQRYVAAIRKVAPVLLEVLLGGEE